MPSGGGRNRSGPQKDPNSLRGAGRTGLRALPIKKYTGAYPEFPLPGAAPREVELWNAAWTAPQAHVWVNESWRWQTIALWVRRSYLAESTDANASDVAAMIRLADQIGMTPAGLKENGWTIGGAEKKTSTREDQQEPDQGSSRRRFRVVQGDGEVA